MDRTCPGCDAPIIPGPRERNPRRWCSEACRVREHYKTAPRKVQPRKRRPQQFKACRYCDVMMTNVRRVQCGSPECARQFNNERCREFQRAYVAKHGRSHTHRNIKLASTTPCRGCDKPLKGTRRPDPYCRTCKTPRVRAERCSVPVDHPSRWVGDSSPVSYGECLWCADVFVVRVQQAKYCTRRCKVRHAKVRRVGRINGTGDWRWSEFMQVARRFDYCCAYCGTKPQRLDPDHVVAVSRGGFNTIGNLLPTCLPCNSDKRALSLTEWAADRERRGLEPRATSWHSSDSRYWHLTSLLLAAA